MIHTNRHALTGLTIGVLYGGPSAEREVSIDTGTNVIQALQGAGHTVKPVLLGGSFTVRDAEALGVDVVFLALHGEFGEDGRIQSILEEADVPYTGSGVEASAVAFDKVRAKRVFEEAGVRTPPGCMLTPADLSRIQAQGVGVELPLVVKPARAGSSLGVTIVRQPEAILPALQKAFQYDSNAIVERFIKGRELTVGVLGDAALPVTELIIASEFYDYHAKYQATTTRIVCPAELDASVAAEVQAVGLSAHRALGCRDVSRTDVILDERNVPWALEVNTLPGLTSHSLLPRAAAAAGRDCAMLCEELLCLALKRTARTQAA